MNYPSLILDKGGKIRLHAQTGLVLATMAVNRGKRLTWGQFRSRLSTTTLPKKPSPPVIKILPDISCLMLSCVCILAIAALAALLPLC
jgi:hypothetical protein